MKCTDCGRKTCPTLAIHPQEYVDELKAERDCLRAQLAAANERADLANARADSEEAAHRETRARLHSLTDSLHDAIPRGALRALFRNVAAEAFRRARLNGTPMLDKFINGACDWTLATIDAGTVVEWWARVQSAERERDEALRHAQTSDAMMRQARDRAAALAQKVDEQTARAHEAERERDEARHAHSDTLALLDGAQAMLTQVGRERDEAVKRASAARSFPGGWPVPAFMSVWDDGSFNIEWCFGRQGADDSWRLSFSLNPGEPAWACKTTMTEQIEAEGDDIPAFLKSALDAARGRG